MAFLESYELSVNPEFRKRIQIAIAKIALDVVGEASSGIVVKDKRRKDLGIGILNNPSAYVERFSIAVVTNPVINSNSSDGDIEFTVSSVFDDIAGVG
jgi:hypothetical protein